MRYKLLWTSGSYESMDWNDIISHEHFQSGDVLEYVPLIGWVVI